MDLRDVGELGTVQSNINDFYDTVVATGLLGRAPLVLDIGANVGQFTRSVKLFRPDAELVCFEPDPEVFAQLTRNVGFLDGVSTHNIGLGGTTGMASFHRHELSVMSTFRSPAGERYGAQAPIALPLRRLDDVIGADIRPDLVKIDVEGFEREVLAGGWDTVRRSRLLLVEVSLGREAGRDNLDLLSAVKAEVPEASIVRFGRALGPGGRRTARTS